MSKSKPEPLDIDADPRNADWLHRKPQEKQKEKSYESPEQPEQPAESDEHADER